MAVVRGAQVGLGTSLPHVGWIDVDDLPAVNQHHLTAEGQLTIDRRFAREFLKLIEPRP